MRTKYSKSVEAGKSVHSRWNLGLLVESEGRLGREKKHEVLVGFGSKMFSFYAVLTLDIRHQIRVAGAQGSGASWDSRAGSWRISFVKPQISKNLLEEAKVFLVPGHACWQPSRPSWSPVLPDPQNVGAAET